MKEISITQDPKVEPVFQEVPEHARPKLLRLRQLILDTSRETEGVKKLVETLKWGEPSYLTPIGSTIRIHWKAKNPDQIAMYFQCTSKLVPTFRQVFAEIFKFEGNRAILFDLKEELPEAEIKQCIAAGLTYHKAKHKVLLGF